METLDVIVLAAGKGTRIVDAVAKQFHDLNGRPVMIRALEKFEQLPFVGTKYVTAHADDAGRVEDVLKEHAITNFQVVLGGRTRQESVRAALEFVRTRRVITHTAALPFVTKELISNVVREDYACVTTVTRMPYNLCRGRDFAEEAVPVEDLKLINTPQSFHTEIFRQCHRQALQAGIVVRSDCELMLHYGHRVRFVEGDPRNFKITTPLDMLLAEALARQIDSQET